MARRLFHRYRRPTPRDSRFRPRRSAQRQLPGQRHVGPVEVGPVGGLATDFVVEADRAQLNEIVQRVRDGRLRTHIGTVATLGDAVAAFNSRERHPGKTIIRVRQ